MLRNGLGGRRVVPWGQAFMSAWQQYGALLALSANAAWRLTSGMGGARIHASMLHELTVHSATTLMTSYRYGATHPEWFALAPDGSRGYGARG
jgi:hypothetical protein